MTDLIEEMWEWVVAEVDAKNDGGMVYKAVRASWRSHVGRQYHNEDHLEFMLRAAKAHMDIPEFRGAEWDAIILATFFHDIVYDPRFNDSENRSSELADQWLTKLEVNESLILKVQLMIESTWYARTLAKPNIELSLEAKILRDLDFLGFAQKTYVAMTNGRKVFCEYDALTPNSRREIIRGRITFMNAMLADPQNIYRTDYFRANHLIDAIDNIKYELKVLHIPGKDEIIYHYNEAIGELEAADEDKEE